MLSFKAPNRAGRGHHRHDDNRRFAVRVELELDVDVTMNDTFFTAFTGNVSRGGLFFAWHAFEGRSPRLSERLSLRFSLPGVRDPIAATAEVRWARQGKPGGVGVAFVDLAPDSARLLNDFVDMRAPLAA
jgi:uncharacterized protein (TIGR02266 family)